MSETTEAVGFGADEMSAEKARDPRGTAKRFFRDLMVQKGRLLAITLCLLGAAACSVFIPITLGAAIDEVFDGVRRAVEHETAFQVSFETMGTVLVELIALYLLSAALTFVEEYLMASVAQNFALKLRREMAAKLERLPVSYYDAHRRGDILSRMTNDAKRVADTLQEGIAQFITATATIVGSFVVMVGVSVELTFWAFGTVVAGIALTMIISSATYKAYAKNQETLGRLNVQIEEGLTGHATIRAFGLQEESTQKVRAAADAYRKAGLRAQFLTYGVMPIVRFASQFGYAAIAVRGAMMAVSGTITLGDIQAMLQYVDRISEPVSEFAFTITSAQGALASAERIYQLLDEEDELDLRTNAKVLPKPCGKVEFERVEFGYDPDARLFKDVNVAVEPGTMVAIVGPTGAGKTTFVNLLMRFYDPQRGRILVDGMDIRNMSRDELHGVLGMVLQDTWLFNGSIAENIAYGKPNASREEIERAAKAARIDHFIKTLPRGYDTVVDDELLPMSAGQKQLITIARALLADPPILILDEATSNVDTRTEAAIQEAMANLMEGRTSFVIAHRLSTIRDADLILVMEAGDIVEQGTHEDLMARGGRYAELQKSQASALVA